MASNVPMTRRAKREAFMVFSGAAGSAAGPFTHRFRLRAAFRNYRSERDPLQIRR